jgi:pimeloyl-ACP methyl ester carboxylesterase
MDMAKTVGRHAGLRQMRALLGIRAPFENLGEIRCPTKILGGRLDRRTTPVEHEAVAGEIPGATLVIVDGAAHITPLEQPGTVTQALEEWLRL